MEEETRDQRTCEHVVRGYFGLGDYERVVHVTCDADFVLHTWAMNVRDCPGGVEFLTPPSQFRGGGFIDPADRITLNVPQQTGMSLGAIGGQAGETIDISNAHDAPVTVFLTVVTCHEATVSMTWDEV
jgi:hypothetical protein